MLHNNHQAFGPHQIIESNGFSNLRTLLKELKNKQISVVKMKQIHCADVSVFEKQNETKNIIRLTNTDALVSAEKQRAYVVKTADCLPIFISHPSGWIAAIHAGRKGSDNHILLNTLEALYKKIGTKENFQLYFGAHIHENSYQIDREKDLYYSLLKVNKKQCDTFFEDIPYTLTCSDHCTYSHPDYFSYRETATKQRNYSVLIVY